MISHSNRTGVLTFENVGQKQQCSSRHKRMKGGGFFRCVVNCVCVEREREREKFIDNQIDD